MVVSAVSLHAKERTMEGHVFVITFQDDFSISTLTMKKS